jgi:hypothetical protein
MTSYPTFSGEDYPSLSRESASEGIKFFWDIEKLSGTPLPEKELIRVLKRGTVEQKVQAMASLIDTPISDKIIKFVFKLYDEYSGDPAGRYLAGILLLEQKTDKAIGLLKQAYPSSGVLGALCAHIIKTQNEKAFSYLEHLAQYGSFDTKCYAFTALAFTEKEAAIDAVLHKADKEWINTIEYKDEGQSIGRGNFWLGLAASTIDHFQKQAQRVRYGSSLVDGSVELSLLTDDSPMKLPKSARLMYVQHMRATALEMLLLHLGPDIGLRKLKTTKQSTQRTILASALLELGVDDPAIAQSFQQSLSARHFSERLLAYEGMITLERETGKQEFAQAALKGLNDSDAATRIAVASAILSQEAERLYPQALTKVDSKKEDDRIGITPMVVALDSVGHPLAKDALHKLKNDRSAKVRSFVESWQATVNESA